MTYVDGFVAAVPTANRQAFRKHANKVTRATRRMGPAGHPLGQDEDRRAAA